MIVFPRKRYLCLMEKSIFTFLKVSAIAFYSPCMHASRAEKPTTSQIKVFFFSTFLLVMKSRFKKIKCSE